MITRPFSFIFFGTSEFSVITLETLRGYGMIPLAVVTTPDRPQGRKLVMTPPPTKVWANTQSVPILQFEKLDAEAIQTLSALKADLFIVASYGKIIPQAVLDIPREGALNVHPSLLPLYRGSSPLQSTILADDSVTGVTIIKMDALMDHGPIVSMKKVPIDAWPPKYSDLERTLAVRGAQMLAESIESYRDGSLVPEEQKHGDATFTKKITKEDGLIDLTDTSPSAARKSYLKIQAFERWPGTYFFTERKGKRIRVAIKQADFQKGLDASGDKLTLLRVLPEGGKEMSYEDFQRGI